MEALRVTPDTVYGDAALQTARPQVWRASNFVHGVRWSPDGLCLLAASEDAVLRVFEHTTGAFVAPGQDALVPALACREAEAVADWAWYPRMDSRQPASCVFAATGPDQPVHLWDAFTGRLRCSYRGVDHQIDNRLAPALSLAFSADGARLYAGGVGAIRVFDTSVPGPTHSTIDAATSRTGRRRGAVSSLAASPTHPGLFAAGSLHGLVALYSEGEGGAVIDLLSGLAPVTQLRFSPCGSSVFVGCRGARSISVWDIRHTAGELARLDRPAPGNQRIGFDVAGDGASLVSGSDGPDLVVFSAAGGVWAQTPRQRLPAGPPASVASSVSLHPFHGGVAAVSYGKRLHRSLDGDDDEDVAYNAVSVMRFPAG